MKTQADLLAQLEAEQAAGDPGWLGLSGPAINEVGERALTELIHLLSTQLPWSNDNTVVRLHPRSRKAA